MKRVMIISLGYLWFPGEPGPSRIFDLAKMLVKAGVELECVTSDFQHFTKSKRNKEVILKQDHPFKITFIKSPKYHHNISIRRILSNIVSSYRVSKYLENRLDNVDVVYLTIPSNRIAKLVSNQCRKKGVTFIVDVEDLWPEAMYRYVKNNKIRKLFLKKIEKDADEAYNNASAVVGTSEDYTSRAFKKRKRNIPNETVYVGCDLDAFDRGVLENEKYIQKNDNEYWITYTGSISNSYDIKTLIDAVNDLSDKNIHAQILGTGGMIDELKAYSKNMQNIHFWGYVDYDRMAAVLNKSDIVINSFVKGAPQSIVNKIGDYLASGKPIINTLENPVFCNIVNKYDIGVNIEAENVEALKNAIIDELGDELRGINARKLAEQQFDRKTSYKRIIDLIVD
ncbi:glycosyltransferase family 4 protein [Lachnospira multipara]|uniref:glycosyltransferase family 4 protein n=1 Tax=Lachnospira multipara TaxID=28051 RepID=UPI0004E13112|nr:glycosyltransferase family 4 protein [Lachnospira multipara]